MRANAEIRWTGRERGRRFDYDDEDGRKLRLKVADYVNSRGSFEGDVISIEVDQSERLHTA